MSTDNNDDNKSRPTPAAETAGGGDSGFAVDWESVGKPPKPGKYHVRVKDAEYRLSKETQVDTIHLTLIIVAAFDYDNADCVGRMVFDTMAFTLKALFRFKQFADATGLALPSIINRDVVAGLVAPMRDRECGVVLVEETYNGVKRARVSSYHPLPR